MDDLIVVKDGRIDVAEVMARIREKVRAERREGRYTDDEVEELVALKLQAFADDAEAEAELPARIVGAPPDWNVAADYRIRTHRGGLAGRLVVLLKTLARPWVRLYTDHVVGRQAQINLQQRFLSQKIVAEVVRQQLELAALRARLEKLEAERVRDGRGPTGA